MKIFFDRNTTLKQALGFIRENYDCNGLKFRFHNEVVIVEVL